MQRRCFGGSRGTPLWLCLCPIAVAMCVWQWRRANFHHAARAIFASLAVLYVVGFWEFGQRAETLSVTSKAIRHTPVQSPFLAKYPELERDTMSRIGKRGGTKIDLNPRWR